MSRFVLLVIAVALVQCNAQEDAANDTQTPEAPAVLPPQEASSSASPLPSSDDVMPNDAPAVDPVSSPEPSPEVPAAVSTEAVPQKPSEAAPTREPAKPSTFAPLMHNNTEEAPVTAATGSISTEKPNKNSSNALKSPAFGCVLIALAAIYYQSY